MPQYTVLEISHKKVLVNSLLSDRSLYWVLMAAVFTLNCMFCPIWLTASSEQPSFSSQTIQMTICKGVWERRCGSRLSNSHIHSNTEENDLLSPIFFFTLLRHWYVHKWKINLIGVAPTVTLQGLWNEEKVWNRFFQIIQSNKHKWAFRLRAHSEWTDRK